MIGNDLLPNTYIDRVDVYDGVFEASVYCVDSIESPLWSNHALSMKYFKIMVVSTQHLTLINNFRFGVIRMDPKAILKQDPNAIITYYPVKRISPVENKGYNNFKIKAKHSYSNQSQLNVYASVVVDPVEIAGPKFITENFITGPVVSEIVLDAGGAIPMSTSVWTLPDGSQWTGPVHRHPTEGYMQFSSHSEQDHQKVTQVLVKNIKTRDLRQKNVEPSRLSSIKNDITEVSELFNSFSTEGNSNSIFFINIKQIISKNTKFGSVFLSLKPEYYMPIINDFSFRLVNVERQMVRTSFINNKKRITKILQTKKVLSAYEQNNTFITTLGNNTIRRTVFPMDETIIAFEFNDQEANINLSGQFQYNVSLFFKDPTVAESQNILNELNSASVAVDKYLGRIVRNLRTNEERNNPPQSWIDSENNLYTDDINKAPWIMAPKIFAKYKKMFFETNEDHEKTESDSYAMLSPRSFTINSINRFKADLNLIILHVNKAFNVRTRPVSNFSDFSMPKNSYVSNLIEKKFHFNKIFEPSINKKYYNVLSETQEQQFTKRISLLDFKNRVSIEFNKFFNENQQTQTGNLETNLEISMASYFSPLSLGEAGNSKIDLSDLSNIDKEKFNTFFDNLPKRRFKKRKKPSRKQKFTITPRIIPIEKEDYVEAREYLGESSNFLTAQERDDLRQAKKASIKTINNISNRITKTSSKTKQRISKNKVHNIFKPEIANRAPTTLSGRTLIPNQFRSFNVGLVPASKEIFDNDQIQEAENELIVSVNYLTLTQIESLVNFKTTENGVKLMNSPIWEIVTAEQIEDLSSGVLCRMETIKNPVSNFEPDQRTILPYSDKYFIISDVELPAFNASDIANIDSTLSDSYLSSTQFDIAGATSEILDQNVSHEEEIFKVKIEQFDVEAPSAPTRSRPPSQPRAGSRITGRARRTTSRGGGY